MTKPKTKNSKSKQAKKPKKADTKAKASEKPQTWNLYPEKKRIAEILAFNGYTPGGTGKGRNGAFSLACEVGKVSKQTLSRWVKEPDFMEYVEHQKAQVVDDAMTCIRDGITAKNPIAAMFSLKTICPDIYDESMRLAKLRHQQALEMEKVKHVHAKELMELKVALGLPPEDEDIEYQLEVFDAGPPPPPEERH